MGAIQNSLNQAMGAVAAAGIGLKHVKEQEAANVISTQRESVIAEEQAKDAETKRDEAEHAWYTKTNEDGITDAGELAYLKEDRIPELQKEYSELKKRGASLSELGKNRTELSEAKVAKRELEIKAKAITDLKERARIRRELADTLTHTAINKKEKYNKKWGGNM